MATETLTLSPENVSIQFQQASAQTKLLVLYYLAKQLREASAKTTPSAFFSQKVQGMLKQLQQLPQEERGEALHEILSGVPTRLSEAYEALDTNMKMAFWYRLANGRRGEARLLQPTVDESSFEQEILLKDLANRDSNELVSCLRDIVSGNELIYRY